MIECICNLWDQRTLGAICITTNGDLNARQHAIMGRGVARQAKQLFPQVPRILGNRILNTGNHVALILDTTEIGLISFPVKHHWHEVADLDLIRQSTYELLGLNARHCFPQIYLPRPGCGNGGLDWKDVQPVLAPLLDDRFTIVSVAGSR